MAVMLLKLDQKEKCLGLWEGSNAISSFLDQYCTKTVWLRKLSKLVDTRVHFVHITGQEDQPDIGYIKNKTHEGQKLHAEFGSICLTFLLQETTRAKVKQNNTSGAIKHIQVHSLRSENANLVTKHTHNLETGLCTFLIRLCTAK